MPRPRFEPRGLLSVGGVLLSVLLATCTRSAPRGWGETVTDAGLAAPRARAAPTGPVTNYHMVLAERGSWVAIRAFERGGQRWLLAVDPMGLGARLLPHDGELEGVSWQALGAKYPASPWLRARLDANQHAVSLQDSGLTHLLPSELGVALTVDLCPSRRRFDARLVRRLVSAFAAEEKPIPVAFALSGVWALEHPEDLEALQHLDGTELSITWMNHSMHHRYSPGVPLRENFMLEPGTDVATEVLDAERVMLERGITPSVFFRFPGLVSEPTLITFVTAMGLVPVGSDAWLAKGERARGGSIVLVHGNGNEERGVDDFFALIDAERRAIARRQFLLLDLRAEVAEEESADR